MLGFVLAALLVLLVVWNPDDAPPPQCDCSHTSTTLTPLDSTNQLALVASVGCVPGICKKDGQPDSDSSTCRFNVRYEVMVKSWDGSFDLISDTYFEFLEEELFDEEQSLDWSGGDTDDWSGSGTEGVVWGDQNYWVPCGERKEFDVVFRSSKVVTTNPYYRDGDTIVDVIHTDTLSLRTHVVLECGSCPGAGQ